MKELKAIIADSDPRTEKHTFTVHFEKENKDVAFSHTDYEINRCIKMDGTIYDINIKWFKEDE